MNLINEFALLFAVSAPLVVLFGMNLFLLLEGERGTLMFPTTLLSPEGVAGEDLRMEMPANEPQFRRAA